MDGPLVLDMPTLVFARIISVLVFAIGVPIMTLRKDRPETAIFCWSLLMALCSWVTVIGAVLTSNIYIAALYTGCISATVALQWAAIVSLAGRRIHPIWFAGPPIGVMVSVLAFQLNSAEAALLSCCVLSLQLGVASAFVMVCGRRVVRSSTAVLMALGYAISFCSAISRPLEFFIFGQVSIYALSGDPTNTLPFLSSYVGTTLIILSWLAALKDRAEARLAELAFRDELTGLANRRALHEQGRRTWAQARLQGFAFTMVVIDLDHFKQVNDQWGHEEGDRVLSVFGKALSTAQPPPALAARMGGEEFALIYTGADARAAHDFVEAFRDDLVAQLQLPDGRPMRFSAGIAQAGMSDDSISALYRRADAALYQAKACGRDCAIIDRGIESSEAA